MLQPLVERGGTMSSEANAARSADATPRVGSHEKRRQERRDCLSKGALSLGGENVACTVVNISEGGGGIIINSATHLAIGQKVTVSTQDIGAVESTVRWAAHPRYGLQLTQQAQPEQYARFFQTLSPERILAERVNFIGFEKEAQARLVSLASLLAQEMPPALQKLYMRIAETNGVREFFPTQTAVERAKAAQIRHWATIASGRLSGEYLGGVRRIGETHARIGLEPHWYIGGYAIILEHLIEAVVHARAPRSFGRAKPAPEMSELARTLSALVKAVLLDIGSAVSVYLDAASEARLEGEAETITLERTLVANSIGEGLAELARRNLTHRMKQELPDIYRGIQANFNGAIGQIDETLIAASNSVRAVQAGVSEISSAADDLSMRTERQAASLEQTAAALNEITSAAAATATNVNQAQEAVANTRRSVEAGADVVRRTVEAMQMIAESSRKISHFIGVIDEIAFQTNLLALNAGVEAARAGDAGRGFAVVAAEVRALALRSAEAAKEIKALISNSAAQVGDGVKLVDATGSTLTQISGQVAGMNALMTEVAASAQSQAAGLREVNLAISDMDKVTQQNAAMAEQSSAACKSALGESENLSRLVDSFELSKPKAEAGGLKHVATKMRSAAA
jgi:methyl-accepting chemotaxis protein